MPSSLSCSMCIVWRAFYNTRIIDRGTGSLTPESAAQGGSLVPSWHSESVCGLPDLHLSHIPPHPGDSDWPLSLSVSCTAFPQSASQGGVALLPLPKRPWCRHVVHLGCRRMFQHCFQGVKGIKFCTFDSNDPKLLLSSLPPARVYIYIYIHKLNVLRSSYREIPCAFHSVSPSDNILQN